MRPEPRWEPVHPVGHPAAIDSMGTIAAPLLASITIAIFVFVSTDSKHLRWPHTTLGLLLSSFFALLAAVQLAFRAREYVATPSQIQEWWPLDDDATREYHRRVQRHHSRRFHQWAARARWSYNLGLLALLAAVATLAVPAPGPISHGGWIVEGLALAAFVAEAGWIARDHLGRKKGVTLPDVGPEWRPQ